MLLWTYLGLLLFQLCKCPTIKMSILSFQQNIKQTPHDSGGALIQIENKAKTNKNPELCGKPLFSLLFHIRNPNGRAPLWSKSQTINLTCLQGSVILLGLRHYFYWDRKIASPTQASNNWKKK